MKITLHVDVELVDGFDNKETIARIYYPDEGNKIQIKKGLSRLDVDEAICHEIGHLVDWYMGQSSEKRIREVNAVLIEEGLNELRRTNGP